MAAQSSLRQQLSIGVGITTLLIGAAMLLALPQQFDRLGQRAMEQEALALVTVVAEGSGPSVLTARALEEPELAGAQLPVLKATPQVLAAALYEPGGDLITFFQTDAAAARAPFVAASVRNTPTGTLWTDDTLVVWANMQDGKGELFGRAELTLSTERLATARQENLQTAAIFTAGLALSLLVAMSLLGSRLTGPILALTQVADDVATGKTTLRIPPEAAQGEKDTNNELARLTRAFFTMLSRLQASQEALREQVVEVDKQRAAAEAQREQADAARTRAQEALHHLQQTQDQLVRSEKMASLGQLIAGIAHELNTPMGAVNASAEILQQRLRSTLASLGQTMPAADQEALTLALQLVEASLGRPRLGGRDGRRARRALQATLEGRGLSDTDALADALLEVGYRPDEAVWTAVVNHDAVASVVGLAEQISPLVRNADNVRLAAQKARKIVLALKTFSHQGSDGVGGERAQVSLRDNISTVLTLYENQFKRGVAVEIDLNGDLHVHGDPDALSQVWTNLVQNGIQAMKGEGKLWVRGSRTQDNQIEIAVGNNGPPIPPDLQGRIFEAFFTTKKAGEGTGLGLDIVRRILVDHGGDITVASDEDTTVFTVSLPGLPA